MDDDRCRLVWKSGEDVTKWILQVETYALARGWNNSKLAATAAVGLPDDKVEFLLTMPEEERKDWSKLKKAILTESTADVATAEQTFLNRKRQAGESFLVTLPFWSACTVKRLRLNLRQTSLNRFFEITARFFKQFGETCESYGQGLLSVPLPKTHLSSSLPNLLKSKSNHFVKNLKTLKQFSKHGRFKNHQVKCMVVHVAHWRQTQIEVPQFYQNAHGLSVVLPSMFLLQSIK